MSLVCQIKFVVGDTKWTFLIVFSFILVRSPSPADLGVPGKPGSDSLDRRLEQLKSRRQRRQAGGKTRPDLGTVSTKKAPEPEDTSALGTLSSLLFGRKGGWF